LDLPVLEKEIETEEKNLFAGKATGIIFLLMKKWKGKKMDY